MPRIVKIAQIGCGSIAQRAVLPRFRGIKDKVELVATMDVASERAKLAMEKFGAEEWYDDYDKLLSQADIDAVTIATPIGLHYDQVMKAIKAGKHVHSHKTITTSAREATDIIEAAKKREVRVVASPGTSVRSPIVKRIRQIVGEGIIGKVYWVQAGRQWRGHEYEPFRKADDIAANVSPAWYYKQGGGPMYDMAVYELTEMVSIFGPARKVAGMSGIGLAQRVFKGEKIDVETDDDTLIMLEFGGPMFASLICSFSALADEGPVPPLAISGSDGGIRICKFRLPQYQTSLDIWSSKIPEGHMSEKVVGYAEDAWMDIVHLIDCVVNDVQPTVLDNIESMQIARHVIEIIEKGYVAAKTGLTQKLDTAF
jgi:predicted dehydrogenase